MLLNKYYKVFFCFPGTKTATKRVFPRYIRVSMRTDTDIKNDRNFALEKFGFLFLNHYTWIFYVFYSKELKQMTVC